MRACCLVLTLAVSSVVLTGCGSAADGTADQAEAPTLAPAPLVTTVRSNYQVPDWQCPPGWTGLRLETDNPAEVKYLDAMPACTDSSRTRSYLENKTDAVWVLSSTSVAGTWRSDRPSLERASFSGLAQARRPGTVVLAPGEAGTVDLPADGIRWDLDLPLSFGWEAHSIVAEKIASKGEAAVIAAFERRSPAGAAIASCTLAATEMASTYEELDEADATEVLVTSLGSAAAGGVCARQASRVPVVEAQTRQRVALSTALSRVSRVTEGVEAAHTRLEGAQSWAKLARSGVRWILS